MRVAVYARKSGRSGDPRTQADGVADWARSCHGATEVEIYAEAISGRDANRPQFNCLVVAAMCGRFDAIAVQAVDRLARGPEIANGLVEGFKKLGVEVLVQHPEWIF